MDHDSPRAGPFTCPRCQGVITGRLAVAAGFCVTCGDCTRPPVSTPSFTCPRPECGITNYRPADIAEGFCAACDAWTGTGAAESDDAMAVTFGGPRPHGRGARAGGAGGP